MLGRRALLAAGGAGLLSGCAATMPRRPGLHRLPPPVVTDGVFDMPDGAALPFRRWMPVGQVETVALALHGINDSRDAFELAGPVLAAAGIAVYAPDQRGFGAATGRGRWPGAAALCGDAAVMARLLATRHPDVRLVAIGESMGGAVLMRLAATRPPPGIGAYVLAAPAVWGRAEMDLLLRGSLWIASHTVPGMVLADGGPVRVRATDNYGALLRLSGDPLTQHDTRVDTLRGLVDLMGDALRGAARFDAPGLFLYGAHDELVPKHAMRAAWQALPSEAPETLAYYPHGYHLLLRDLDRAEVLGDILAWLADADAPLPSKADRAAAQWLARTA